MKKYLITSAAALALCGLITSCSHDIDGLTPEESVAATYEKAFITAFGQPAPDQTWGFGTSTVAGTRGTRADVFGFSLPTNPTFKDKDDIVEPTISGVYNTVADATNAGVTVVDATNKQNFNVESNKSYAIDSNSSLSNLGNVSNTVIYITENMAFNMSLNQNANNTVVVTKGKTVTVNSVNQYQTYYVAEGATLNFSYDISVERGFHLFMGSGSTVNTQNITIKGVNPTSSIKNIGGTLNIGTEQNKKTLTLENGVTLWNEGTVNVYQEFKMVNNNSAVYNAPGHIISIPSLTINNNYNLIVNDGTFTINGGIELSNVNAEVVNNGNLSGTSLSLKAGGKFHNTGTTTITGKTTVDNNNSIGGEWKNEGTFITEDFEIKAFAQKVWNCCKMIVHKADNTGVFKIYGEFVLDRGASIKTDNVDWVNKSNVYMNGLSLFKVEETFDSNNYDRECGIHAMSDEWAVLQAKSIVQRDNVNNQFRMAYYGNLWVDAESHFDIWYKDTNSATPGDQPNYKFFGNAKFGHEGDEGCPVIPVENTNGRNYSCTPGYNETPEPSGDVVRVVAEDLTASAGNDFDFNDVVFDVELKDNNVVYVYVRAAGGTLPLYLGEDDEAVEVHGLFGQDTGIMINTGGTTKGYANCIDNLAPKGISLRNPLAGQADATNVRQVAKAIKVTVIKKVNGTSTPCLLKAEQGEATAKLCVGTDYQYTEGGKTYPCLTERTDIKGQFKYMPENNHPHKGEGKFPLYVQKIFGDDWYRSDAEPLPKSND